MKSKPPTKRAKLEGVAPPAAVVEGLPRTPSSPAGSTTSSVSSLLSIPPPTSSTTTPKTTTTTTADLVAAAKAVASGVKAQTGGGIPPRPQVAPLYPTYVHTDISEWPRMNILINCPKGSLGGDGKPSATLGPDGIMSMDDLDALQAELETLWSAMACRIRSLKGNQSTIQNSSSVAGMTSVAASLGEHFDPHHQEKINAVASLIDAGHGTRTSVSAAAKLVMASQTVPAASGAGAGGGAPGKKTAIAAAKQDKLPKKKLKGEPGSATKKGNEKPTRATQNRSHSVSSDFGGFDGFYKHEAPNEFWDFADNYCGEITADHLDELSKIMDQHENITESMFDIPPLGKHFRDGDNSTKTKNEPKSQKRGDACGPLTQRLVSALVDERVAMYNSNRNHAREESSSNGTGNHELGFIHRAGLIKALGLDGGQNRPMENQLRDCLLERGLLHPEDANDQLLYNPDDEILAEIRRTQNTLKKLHDYNGSKLMELQSKAERELERVSLKEELATADKDVVEAYKSIVSLKQRKKLVSKKEKEVAVKALENRDKALLKLSPSLKSEPVGITSALKVEV